MGSKRGLAARRTATGLRTPAGDLPPCRGPAQAAPSRRGRCVARRAAAPRPARPVDPSPQRPPDDHGCADSARRGARIRCGRMRVRGTRGSRSGAHGDHPHCSRTGAGGAPRALPPRSDPPRSRPGRRGGCRTQRGADRRRTPLSSLTASGRGSARGGPRPQPARCPCCGPSRRLALRQGQLSGGDRRLATRRRWRTRRR